jgi:hypothetical protein
VGAEALSDGHGRLGRATTSWATQASTADLTAHICREVCGEVCIGNLYSPKCLEEEFSEVHIQDSV